MTEPGWTNCG